jgi:hypothetical protein
VFSLRVIIAVGASRGQGTFPNECRDIVNRMIIRDMRQIIHKSVDEDVFAVTVITLANSFCSQVAAQTTTFSLLGIHAFSYEDSSHIQTTLVFILILIMEKPSR